MADLPRAPAVRTPAVARVTAVVANHPSLAFALIVALTVLIVCGYVYYHGLFVFGPYCGHGGAGSAGSSSRALKGKAKAFAKSKAKAAPAKAADSDSDGGDDETERLIETLNSH